MTLTFVSPVTANDEDRFCFRLCNSVEITSNLPVLVTVNGTTVPLLNKFGNAILGNELKARCVYRGWYGADTPHVIIGNTPRTMNCTCS